MSSSITRFLTTPSKVAQALDWRKASGAVLSMTISNNHIDLSVASHPSFHEPSKDLPPLKLSTVIVNNKRTIANDVRTTLQSIMKDYNVCGAIVSWPLQPEGWCGKCCGKTLFVLDHLADTLHNRPVCLVDPDHRTHPDDLWGRSKLYSTTCPTTRHVASQDNYVCPSSKVATDLWKDFMATHWPEMAATTNNNNDDQWEDTTASSWTLPPAVAPPSYHTPVPAAVQPQQMAA